MKPPVLGASRSALQLPMIPHPSVPEDGIHTMVKWILALTRAARPGAGHGAALHPASLTYSA